MRNLLSPLNTPKIYAYADKHYPNLLKIGYTIRDVQNRVQEQYGVIQPEQRWRIVLEETAIRHDGSFFRDGDVHKMLINQGIDRVNGEWFRCSKKEVLAAIKAIKANEPTVDLARYLDFAMRPEQQAAVEKTARYFQQLAEEAEHQARNAKFLWNAKMRFGKTFATYQLVKKMVWQKVLILTFKPAVQSAWKEDLQHHIDFAGWQFVDSKNEAESFNPGEKREKPLIWFGSLQDFLGKDKKGQVKERNRWVHEVNWDCIIFDEYHFGAWRDNTKKLVNDDEVDEDYFAGDEQDLPITANHYLYLSGTPFRALQTGEFIEEAVYNWTYADEQSAKEQWNESTQGANPYLPLPQMVMLTYKLPDYVTEVALKGEFSEFDLGEFFKAECVKGDKENAYFVYEEAVQKWLNIIRYGSNTLHTSIDELKMGAEKPPMPFSDVNLMNALLHTIWFLPNVAACYAMRNLLAKPVNKFYHDYKIIVAAGKKAGIGVKALEPVRKAIGKNPLYSKTITLTCGKLTTGVSVPEWAGIFMLRNSSTPESYFQAAFRVQTPWTIKGQDPNKPNDAVIVKEKCYVFDFAPNRALSQIADYCNSLNVDSQIALEKKVADFLEFLPVLSYDGGVMVPVNAEALLDLATRGISATLLARRWQSALLVNVNNDVLTQLQNNPEALAALEKIEGFRSINEDITTIINKSEAIKDRKKKEKTDSLTDKEKVEQKADEKERSSLRKKIQEKLIQFATRIPVFMYLTDDRENCLHDVITQIEPQLFEKVTGLTQKDFELLVSLDLFNKNLMNSAIYNFRRYEDASLNYTGIDRHQEDSRVGLWDTTITQQEFHQSL